ncbi:MAG: transglycosylase SLT domain-containing protein [Bradymonadia bacterium]
MASSAHAEKNTFNAHTTAEHFKLILTRVENNRPPDVRTIWDTSAQVSILNSIEQHYWSRRDYDNQAYQKTLRRLMRLPPFWRNLPSSRLMKSKSLDALDLGHSGQRKSPLVILLSILPSSSGLWPLIEKVTQLPQITQNAISLAHQAQRSPRLLVTRLSNQLIKYRTEHALTMRNPKQAISILDTLNSNTNVPCWWWYLKLKSLRNLRRWTQAKIHFKQARSQCSLQAQETPWLWSLGISVLWTNGAHEEAMELANALIREYPTHRLADDALYKLVSLDLKRFQEPNRVFDLVWQTANSNRIGDRIDDTTFKLAIAYFRRQSWQRARQLLSHLCINPHWFERQGEEGRCRYWLNRVNAKLDSTSKRHYQDIFTAYPYSWYGRLSRQRVSGSNATANRRLRSKRREIEDAITGISTIISERMNSASIPHVQDFLNHAIEALSALKMSTESFACDVKNHHLCLVQSLQTQPPHSLLPPNRGDKERATYFPMPYRKWVKRASRKHKVPKSVIWAIMREESRFDPEAISFVGAQGLMQLMPSTAREMSRRGSPISSNRLDPKTNILLGTRYLSLVKRYTKAPWVIVAPGYNAGQGALKKWLRKYPKIDLDLFVELIPYDEARQYTKRVNRSIQVYRTLNDRRPFNLLQRL